MGCEYEVAVWRADIEDDCKYVPYWDGDTLWEALASMNKARDEGYKCIKLEWRPQ